MVDFLKEALTSGPFLPQGHCYLWRSALIWLHVASDTLIAVASYVMPIILLSFVRKRRDLPFDWMFLMLGAFLVACGTTHLLGVWNVWYPTYWAAGAVKAMTAAISLSTTVLLPLVLKAFTIPCPVQREAINRDLEEQILECEQMEASPLEVRDKCERRGQERRAELAAANHALHAANVLLEKTFSSLDEALFLIDASTRTIITCNPAVERIFGYSPYEVLGRNTAFLYPSHERYIAFGAELKEALDAHGVHRAELQMRRKDGSLFIGEATVSAIADETGQRARVVSVWRDITERKQAEQAIKNLNAELEQRVIERTAQLEATNHELETFSYSVSHDLRAPLRSIDGFSQALLEDYAERLDPEGVDYLQRIRGATKRMAELIDALLALSRVTRAELQRDAVDLSSTARAVAAELQEHAPERQVDWIIADGLVANGDARLLRVVLENLLGNAWKFTAKTHTPRIEFGRLSLANGSAAFFVRDNGAGFDMTYADKLFGAFQRLHRVGEFQGTGIGLATVQRIIHRHGGRVWAQGSVDEGATFYFTL